jgi:glyoxylase-like metal-dependent hydrolase (beta-lactamase superfamily II)
LLDRDDAVYWPTHGPPVTDPRRLVNAYLAHRHERSEQVLAGLGEGAATIAELVPRVYAEVAKGLWKAAASSMYAHLLHLLDEGAVTVDGPPRRTARWALV